MKIIDFDEKFYEFMRSWMAKHPKVTAKQVENRYNELMAEWIAAPAEWLDGATPETYFDRFETPQELIELLRGYHAANVNLPEPLYTRIASLGAACAPLLLEVVRDETADEALRAEATVLLAETGGADDLMVKLVLTAEESNELSDIAADALSNGNGEYVGRLLKAYPAAPDYAQGLILDIASNFPGDDRIYTYLIKRLNNRPEERALNASLLAKLGDARAVEPMKKMLGFFDLRYLDYIELRNAVEELGGDPGSERTFYGDPDFEALRNLE